MSNDGIDILLNNLTNSKNELNGFINMLPDGNIKDKFNELLGKIEAGDIDIEYFKTEIEKIKEYANTNNSI